MQEEFGENCGENVSGNMPNFLSILYLINFGRMGRVWREVARGTS